MNKDLNYLVMFILLAVSVSVHPINVIASDSLPNTDSSWSVRNERLANKTALSGTTWVGKDSGGVLWKFEFKKGGELFLTLVSNGNSGPGTWELEDSSTLSMVAFNGQVKFEGRLVAGELKGSLRWRRDNPMEWTAQQEHHGRSKRTPSEKASLITVTPADLEKVELDICNLINSKQFQSARQKLKPYLSLPKGRYYNAHTYYRDKDYINAMKWFKASDQFILSRFYIAKMYMDGAGVNKDSYKAVKLLEDDAKQGHRWSLDLICQSDQAVRYQGTKIGIYCQYGDID